MVELDVVMRAGMPRAKPVIEPSVDDAFRSGVLFDDSRLAVQPIMRGLERVLRSRDLDSLLEPWRYAANRNTRHIVV